MEVGEDGADQEGLGGGDGAPEGGGPGEDGEELGFGEARRGGEAVVEEGADGDVGGGNKADETACMNLDGQAFLFSTVPYRITRSSVGRLRNC